MAIVSNRYLAQTSIYLFYGENALARIRLFCFLQFVFFFKPASYNIGNSKKNEWLC